MHIYVQGTANNQLRLSEIRLSAQRGLGFSRLTLSAEVGGVAPPTEADFFGLDLHGTVYLTVGRISRPFATIAPPATRTLVARESRLDGHVELVMDVPLAVFDEIERTREGQSVELRFDFGGWLRTPHDQWELSGQSTHSQAAAQWDELLEQGGYHQVIRFTVAAGASGAGGEWSTASEGLERARQALLRGDPKAAVGEVRPLIEALWPDLPPLKSGNDRPQDRSLEERFQHLIAALKAITHPPLHGDEVSRQMVWRRSDAVAVIATVAALMQREGDQSPFD